MRDRDLKIVKRIIKHINLILDYMSQVDNAASFKEQAMISDACI